MAIRKDVTPELLAQLKSHLSPEVEQNLTSTGEEGLNERTLTRWLRARKLDVARAAKDLKEHAAWRKGFVPTGIVGEEEVEKHLGQDKSFAPGYDKSGHPTLIAKVKAHRPTTADEFRHFMVYILDLACLMGEEEERRTGRTWDGKVVGILDLQNISLSNCDASGLMVIFECLQHHYVERLYKMYLYNSPTIFYGVWAVVKPFLDPVTRKKVEFVYTKDAAEIFSRDYEPGVLPKELGGTGPERPARQVRRELLAQRQKYRDSLAEGSAPSKTLLPVAGSATSMGTGGGDSTTELVGAQADTQEQAQTLTPQPVAA